MNKNEDLPTKEQVKDVLVLFSIIVVLIVLLILLLQSEKNDQDEKNRQYLIESYAPMSDGAEIKAAYECAKH